MNNNSSDLKESMIKDYVMQVDFNSGNYSVDQIKKDLKNILHETPGVELDYYREPTFTEDKETGERKRTYNEKLRSITVAFSDGDQVIDYGNGNVQSIPKIHKYTYWI